MAAETKGSDGPGGGGSRVRLKWWLALAVVAVLAVAGNFALRSPGIWHRAYGAFAKGALAKLSFKFAGTQAPETAFLSPDGKLMTLAAFRGRAILVNLWATWCEPCVAELPALDALQAAAGGARFQVVALNMDADDVVSARAFLEQHALTHLALYTDPKLALNAALASPGIPASVLYDRQGREIARIYGATDWTSPDARALIARASAPPKEK
jgi:thiol-disulfide isomerase/thioredoxin